MKNDRRFTRRQFLRTATKVSFGVGAGLALPNIFLNRTRAQTGQNPSELIRIGFIGTGRQGVGNIRALLKNAVAVCDVDKNHLAAGAKLITDTGRTCATYSDYRRLLEDKTIDAVCVSTPDHWHGLQAIHACEAGKDVYCEKPLTLTVREGQALVKTVQRTKRIFQTGSQQRSDTRFLQAAEYVRNGRIGKIKRVIVGLVGVNWTDEPAVPDSAPPPELDYDLWLGPAPWRPYNKHRVHYYFRFFWDYAGGQMSNWGAHHLDIAQWGLGMDESGPVVINGRGEFDPQKRFEAPSRFAITYEYANGATVECHSPQAQVEDLLPGRPEVARELLNNRSDFNGTLFEGEKGLLYVNRGVVRVWPEEIFDEPIKDTDVRLYRSPNHHRNWLECIQTRRPPICNEVVGHRTCTVCNLGNLSIRAGRPIKWDPVKEQIVGDRKAAQMLHYTYRKPWQLPRV